MKRMKGKKRPDGERGRQWGGMEGPDGGKRGERERIGGGEARVRGGPNYVYIFWGQIQGRLSDAS